MVNHQNAISPKVSIIIPVYNAEKTLIKCLDTVCAQSYKNFEAILVNDGSSDSSKEICMSYADKDARIYVINQQNAGPSAARNTGIDKATGDYLAFVDSDDYIEHNYLERLFFTAEEHGVEMVICGFYRENNGKCECNKFSHASGYYDEEMCRRVALDIIDDNTASAIHPYSWIRMIRRDVFEEIGLHFNTKIKRSEDYLMWTQIHQKVKSMYIIGDEKLYHYVDNQSSITKSYVKGYWQMCKLLFDELNNVLPKTREVEKRLQAMLIQRSLIALRNASRATRAEYEEDYNSILDDKDLLKAARCVGVFRNSRRARIYAVMLCLRLKKLIMRTFPLQEGDS